MHRDTHTKPQRQDLAALLEQTRQAATRPGIKRHATG